MELTPEEFDTIDQLAKVMAAKFGGFGAYDRDDLYQQAWIIALKALPKFDEGRARLGSYMYNVMYTKMCNFKRDNYYDQREGADPWRNAIRSAMSGDTYIDIRMGGDPFEELIIMEMETQIAGMTQEQAEDFLGLGRGVLSTKQCSKCRDSINRCEFANDKNGKDGLQTWCRQCTSNYYRERVAKRSSA